MAKAPTAVYAKFRAYGGDITAEQVRARTAQSRSVNHKLSHARPEDLKWSG